MVEQLNKFKTWINNANTEFLFFSVLCLFYLNFGVSGNEEIYVGLAKSYYSPEWLPNSFVYDHWVSHRFVFETIFGFLISLFGFEAVVFFGRLLAAGAFAWSLARFFQQIKLSNLEALLVLVVFIKSGQELLPGEWIFMSLEPKVFAYPLVFLSMTELFKGNRKIATLYLIASTYLHVLVAGWIFVYFICYLILNKMDPREWIKISGLYLAGVLPLLLFLAPKVFSGPSEINGMHLNWIYIFFRVPILAPFVNGSLNVDKNWVIWKFIVLAVFFILAVAIHRTRKFSQEIKFFNDFNIIIPVFLLSFLIVSYFDKTGDILKFRPFRGVSLYLFFVYTEIILLLNYTLTRQKLSSAVSNIAVVVLAVLIAHGTFRNVERSFIVPYFFKDQKVNAWEEVLDFAKEKTEKGSIFFIKGIPERTWWSFSRKTDRDLFVSKKFVPVDKNKWYEWYQRLHVKVDNAEQMTDLKKRYKLDYYITIPSRARIGEIVLENSDYVVSRLVNE